LRIGCRVAGADVVDRLDDADPEQIAPQAVDVTPGEVGIVGRGQPGGEAFTARRGLGLLVSNLERELGALLGAGTQVLDLAARLVVDDLVKRLRTLDGRAADPLARRIGIPAQPDAREKRRGLVILV